MLEQQSKQAAANANAEPTGHPVPGGGLRVLAYYMKQNAGVPDRGVVMTILTDFPADRNGMLAILQKHLGNAYVQDIVASLATEQAAVAGALGAQVGANPPAATKAPAIAAKAADPTKTTAATAATPTTTPAPGVHAALRGPDGPSLEAAGSFKNGGLSGEGSATANTSGALAQGEIDYVNANGNNFKQTATASSKTGGLTTSGAGTFDSGTVKVDDTLTASGSGVTGKADLDVANKTGTLTETVTGDSSKKQLVATGSGAVTSGALTGLSETNKVTVDAKGTIGELDGTYVNGATTVKQDLTGSSATGTIGTNGSLTTAVGNNTITNTNAITDTKGVVTATDTLGWANKVGDTASQTFNANLGTQTYGTTGTELFKDGANTFKNSNALTDAKGVLTGSDTFDWSNKAGNDANQTLTGNFSTGTFGASGSQLFKDGANTFKNSDSVTDAKGAFSGTDTASWANTAGNSAAQTFNFNTGTSTYGTTGNELFKSGLDTFKNSNAFTDTKGTLSGTDTFDFTNAKGTEINQTVDGNGATGAIGTNGFEAWKTGANAFKNTNSLTDTKGALSGADTFDWTNTGGNEVSQTVTGNTGTGAYGTNGFELFKDGANTYKNTNSFLDTKGALSGADTFDWTAKTGNEINQTVTANGGTGTYGTSGFELFKTPTDTFKNSNSFLDSKGVLSGADTFDWTAKAGNEINQTVTANGGTGAYGTSGFELFKDGANSYKNTNSFLDTKGAITASDTFNWMNSNGNTINQTFNANTATGAYGTSGSELFKSGTDTFKNSNSLTDTKGKYAGSDTFDFLNSKSGTEINQGVTFDTGKNIYGTSGFQKFTTANADTWTFGNQLTDKSGDLSGKGTAEVKAKDGTDITGYGGGDSNGTFDFGGTQSFKGFGLFNGDQVTGSNSATGGNGAFDGKGSLDFTQKNGTTFGGFVDGNTQGGVFDAGLDLKSKSGWSFAQSVGTANGDPTSTGTLSHDIGKYGSVNVAGNADYGKNMYTGSVGYGGPKDGLLKGFSASANGSIDGGVITQGGTVTDNHTFENGGVLTGTGTFGWNGTNGFRDVGNVDYHQALNKTTNADVGAEVNIGSTVGGYAADVYGAVSHTTKNGETVTGAADLGLHNGVAFGGVGGGWDSKTKDADGQAKNSFHAAAMVNNFGPAVGIGGEIGGKVRFRIVLQDLQVVELSVQIPGHHPIANTLLTVGSIATTIGLGGVGFALGAIEKLLGKGHIPGMDKLLQTVGGNAEAKITDANGTTDSTAAAALSKMALMLTEEDTVSLADMHMLTPTGAIDGTIPPDLFHERLALSGLEDAQKTALLAAYKTASHKKKHAKSSHSSAVTEVNSLISSGSRDVNQFANLLDTHPNDMPVLLQVIGDAAGYGAEFANEVARSAGVRDQVVVAPDGTVSFVAPLPTKVVKPATPPAITPAEPQELTENKPETEQEP